MEFRILGPLEVRDGDAVLPVTGERQRALLAVLLLHANEVVSGDRLADELWGEDLPDSGPTALQVRVSQLRKALGPAAVRLETRSPGYVLRVEAGELDLDRFQRLAAEANGAEPEEAADTLREALALWRGPPLADLAYHSFAQAPIRRLEELRLAVLERRLDADLALGRHADVIGELEALVAQEPLHERFRAQLMLALYRSGRQADALEAYRAARDTLVDELGIEPGPALRALEQMILRQDQALDLEPPEAAQRSVLVAVRELARLDALLAVGDPLARRPPKELILACPVQGEHGLGEAATALNSRRETLLGDGVTARAAAFVSGAPAEDLIRLAGEQDVDLVLLDGAPSLTDDSVLADMLTGAPCDVAVLVGGQPGPGRVLVPFVGADHDWAAAELGAWLAGALEVTLLLAGPREGEAGRDSSRLLASASLAVQRSLGVAAEPLLLDTGPDELVAAAGSAGIVVVGLSARWPKEGLGTARLALVASGRPTLVVRRGLRPGGLAPREALTRFTWTL
ncbi:MAG TPA: AfsR/SARP family transcriptional regulator, partial [Thermoleophilia bacterium]|nr:AfsR/SARP family transcriptional regulator [Thermoleophilia bacterium]